MKGILWVAAYFIRGISRQIPFAIFNVDLEGNQATIAGIIGDVVDISLPHVLLNQVGDTVGGEEKSGRGVLIP
jgi:hypothetical protein